MMNSRWQANKIGLINFWYYDEQEFPFVKGRMLLRGSNGSGKSVTMQSVVPLLLDGNMSPERLDPFGSRDRKMSSYLLEEDDGREERTGYLYLELKRQNSDTYLTIGMGIRARRGKNLDKWYFSLTDGRRIGKDFFLYKDSGEKVTLSKKELENRIGDGGRVIDRQVDYMEYVNRQIFGFETTEEYKEMIDLLIQLRTPKLSKDFKPSVINDILSDSLQPLSDDDLRPMSEAIENMDTMNMNLKNRKEAKQAAEKIQGVFSKYNQKLLYEKADRYEQAEIKLENARTQQKEQENLQRSLVKGNGDIITKEISVRDYSAIKVGSTAMGYSDSWFSLFSRGGNPSYVFGYTQGESASLRITIDENLYPYINVQVKNEELSISTENGTQLSPTRFKIEGTSKKLEKIQMSGCMDFVLRSALSGDDLEIIATRGSDVKMEKPVNVSNCIIEATSGSDIIINDLTTRIIRGRASGGSDLKLTGKAENGEYSASGGSDIKAYDLILNQLECSASGGSDIYTHVTDYIKASASGGSDVHYKGSARSDTSTSGGSDIIKEGN